MLMMMLMLAGALSDLHLDQPSGWLYFAVDLWTPDTNMPRKVMNSINGTSPFTDFNPANYEWLSQGYPTLFANGDGQYVYPGPNGPISTIRLEAIRDGLEDWELFLSVVCACF